MDKPFSRHLVPAQMRRKKLDCHKAVQVEIPGFIDDSHAALAQFLCDLVVGYRAAYHMRESYHERGR